MQLVEQCCSSLDIAGWCWWVDDVVALGETHSDLPPAGCSAFGAGSRPATDSVPGLVVCRVLLARGGLQGMLLKLHTFVQRRDVLSLHCPGFWVVAWYGRGKEVYGSGGHYRWRRYDSDQA